MKLGSPRDWLRKIGLSKPLENPAVVGGLARVLTGERPGEVARQVGEQLTAEAAQAAVDSLLSGPRLRLERAALAGIDEERRLAGLTFPEKELAAKAAVDGILAEAIKQIGGQ